MSAKRRGSLDIVVLNAFGEGEHERVCGKRDKFGAPIGDSCWFKSPKNAVQAAKTASMKTDAGLRPRLRGAEAVTHMGPWTNQVEVVYGCYTRGKRTHAKTIQWDY